MAVWATPVVVRFATRGGAWRILHPQRDSSYGKNAANRVEESYGDAKNLRLRHPLAAIGFAFGLRSDIFEKEAETADWLIDLLAKLGQEDDAYHATCLILMEYADGDANGSGDADDSSSEPVPEPGPEAKDEVTPVASIDIDTVIRNLPKVRIVHEKTPDVLSPARFLTRMVERVLAATPINMHKEARHRRRPPAL